jgi:hypothetical protein
MARITKFALVLGYAALAGATVFAHYAPSDGYHISLYASTPVGFWVGIGVAFLVAVPVSYATEGTVRSTALLLAVVSLLAVATLPLSRGHFFYGPADSLTHLGWAKDLLTGRMGVLDLFYPGLHTTSIFTSLLATESIRRGFLLVVALFPLVFVAFTFLAVRAVVTDYVHVVTAVFFALLLLPINHLNTHYMSPHPISDSIMLIPFGLYLLARYVTSVERERPVTKIGVLFAVYSAATVFFHSMQAVHLLILLGGFLLVQLYFRTKATLSDVASDSIDRIRRHRPVYVQTAFLGGLFLVWNLNHEPVRRSILGFVTNLSEVFVGQEQSATYVRTRTGSLSAIGVNPLELVGKLFLPSILLCGLVGVLMIAVFTGRLRTDGSDADTFVEYLCVGLTGLLAFAFVMLVAGSTSTLFFRTLGAVMAVVTVLAVLALPRVASLLPRTPRPQLRKVAAVVLVVGLLAMTIPIVYPSPYIYKPDRMVSEQQLTGHETLFEHQLPDAEVRSVRDGPWRSYHAIYGVETTYDRRDRLRGNGLSFGRLGELQSLSETDYYVSISESDRTREVDVFRELRYTASGFDSLDGQRGVNRIISNGEFHSYFVTTGGESA